MDFKSDKKFMAMSVSKDSDSNNLEMSLQSLGECQCSKYKLTIEELNILLQHFGIDGLKI